MIPLFKSHFSLGKSILTLGKSSEPHKSDSIFQIAKDERLKEIFLLEESMGGFMEAYLTSQEVGIPIRFGVILNAVTSVSLKPKEDSKTSHKIAVFAKNTQGYKDLVKIYTLACDVEGFSRICLDELKFLWTENLYLGIPFYDSFVQNNIFTHKECIPDFSFDEPIFFTENNGLPFDSYIKKGIEKYLKNNKGTIQPTKTILYRKKSDFNAWLTFRCMNSRNFGKISINMPQLSGCCSNTFCFESYLEEKHSTS